MTAHRSYCKDLVVAEPTLIEKYPSSHNHGSPPIAVLFQKQQFSTSMTMGKKVWVKMGIFPK